MTRVVSLDDYRENYMVGLAVCLACGFVFIISYPAGMPETGVACESCKAARAKIVAHLLNPDEVAETCDLELARWEAQLTESDGEPGVVR